MITTHTLRLLPGQDLRTEIESYLVEHSIEASCVLTCVGSLRNAVIRLADQEVHSSFPGPFEIVSLEGTGSIHGSHWHISIADSNGITRGGHLLQGCEIYTTAEIVLGEMIHDRFQRKQCPLSGYPELVVEKKF